MLRVSIALDLRVSLCLVGGLPSAVLLFAADDMCCYDRGRAVLQAEFRECVPVVDSCRICTRGVILESVLRY